jgi:hypothetical protein
MPKLNAQSIDSILREGGMATEGGAGREGENESQIEKFLSEQRQSN